MNSHRRSPNHTKWANYNGNSRYHSSHHHPQYERKQSNYYAHQPGAELSSTRSSNSKPEGQYATNPKINPNKTNQFNHRYQTRGKQNRVSPPPTPITDPFGVNAQYDDQESSSSSSTYNNFYNKSYQNNMNNNMNNDGQQQRNNNNYDNNNNNINGGFGGQSQQNNNMNDNNNINNNYNNNNNNNMRNNNDFRGKNEWVLWSQLDEQNREKISRVFVEYDFGKDVKKGIILPFKNGFYFDFYDSQRYEKRKVKCAGYHCVKWPKNGIYYFNKKEPNDIVNKIYHNAFGHNEVIGRNRYGEREVFAFRDIRVMVSNQNGDMIEDKIKQTDRILKMINAVCNKNMIRDVKNDALSIDELRREVNQIRINAARSLVQMDGAHKCGYKIKMFAHFKCDAAEFHESGRINEWKTSRAKCMARLRANYDSNVVINSIDDIKTAFMIKKNTCTGKCGECATTIIAEHCEIFDRFNDDHRVGGRHRKELCAHCEIGDCDGSMITSMSQRQMASVFATAKYLGHNGGKENRDKHLSVCWTDDDGDLTEILLLVDKVKYDDNGL